MDARSSYRLGMKSYQLDRTSSQMVRLLANIHYGLPWMAGRETNSAGVHRALDACRRRGWLDHKYRLTSLGYAALYFFAQTWSREKWMNQPLSPSLPSNETKSESES